VSRWAIYLCGPSDCPNDDEFEHDGYFGCVPRNFSPTTGRSRTHRQHREEREWFSLGYRYVWDGGCDAQALGELDDAAERGDLLPADPVDPASIIRLDVKASP
jgi:hypothetical protein